MRILFQGDSITDAGRTANPNNGKSLGYGYPYLVAANLMTHYPEKEWDILNRAVSGNRVVDLYARWKMDALNLKPDVLSIMIGVNDTWHEFDFQNGVEVPRYESVYRELLSWTKDVLPKVKLILLEPYVLPFGAVQGKKWLTEINQRRKVVVKLAKEFDAVLIDTQQLLNDAMKKRPMEYWLADGVHPLLAGHQLIADAWVKAAQGILKIKA